MMDDCGWRGSEGRGSEACEIALDVDSIAAAVGLRFVAFIMISSGPPGKPCPSQQILVCRWRVSISVGRVSDPVAPGAGGHLCPRDLGGVLTSSQPLSVACLR